MSREQLLLVSSREKLEKRYGQAGLDKILGSLERYRKSLSKRRVELTTAFVDDKSSISRFGLRPPTSITSASAKRVIDGIVAKLSASLSDKPTSTLGASTSILILGGGDVIPYFRLANPAFDSDGFVFSDNPYGCRPGVTSPEKCLLPDRSVGRMPDGNGSDVQLLLTQIEAASEAAISLSANVFSARANLFGYTAAIWKRASQQVWKDIGGTGNLKICPPVSHVDVTPAWFTDKSFFYFNLHGSETEPYWFGQEGGRFPIALSPANVNRLSHERTVVMTEACYGAIEMGRKRDTSISLAFLSRGSVCMLGSTCTAYGALAPPVSEADLMALNFFRNMHKGMAFGKALVTARAQLAALAVSRQGYLDEDDKKTLLQFVLFGDPTLRILSLSAGSGSNAEDTKRKKDLKKK